MKQYAQLAVPLLIAAACTSGDQRTPTAPESVPAFARQPASSIVVTDLGTLGGTTSDAVSLNTPSVGNRLLIVGSSNDRAGTTHAAYWYVDMTTGARQAGALPAPAGDAQSGAGSVNQAEEIVGGSAATVGGLGRPVRWASSTSSPSFLDITGFTYGGALKITPSGESMGLVGNPYGNQAAIWSGSGLTLLPGLAGGNATMIEDANAAGVIVGMSRYTTTGGGQRAVVWQNGLITQLPDGGSNSFALGINDAGVIVGMDWTSAGGTRAVRWLPPPATIGGSYTMEDLGLFNSIAYDINNTGEIVGQYQSGSNLRAFYWIDGRLKDLPNLATNSGARAINDNGDVAGWSRLRNNYLHAVLWTHVR